MLSKRTALISQFFKPVIQKDEGLDSGAIVKLEVLIAQHHKNLNWKKLELQNIKEELAEARARERLPENKFFPNSEKLTPGQPCQIHQTYLTLHAEIERQEQEKALLMITLKTLKKEDPDDELQEKAESYSQTMRMNLTRIYQQ